MSLATDQRHEQLPVRSLLWIPRILFFFFFFQQYISCGAVHIVRLNLFSLLTRRYSTTIYLHKSLDGWIHDNTVYWQCSAFGLFTLILCGCSRHAAGGKTTRLIHPSNCGGWVRWISKFTSANEPRHFGTSATRLGRQ